MTAYYNEIDPYAAQWLRNLIDAGHIARGDVDERSIVDVRADELAGYDQCHFFAGIGGWSIALRLAGWSDDRPVWTGSCPCQPFSAAGAGKAADDERHLWPAWLPLIAERRPAIVFGEQVEAAIGWGWLDVVLADLEAEGYACGASVLPACGIGAPHIRNRLWFVGHAESQLGEISVRQGRLENPQSRGPSRTSSVADTNGQQELTAATRGFHADAGERGDLGALVDSGAGGWREQPPERSAASDRPRGHDDGCGGTRILGDAADERHERSGSARGRRSRLPNASELGDADEPGLEGRRIALGERAGERSVRSASAAGFWSDAEWIDCTDGKARPVGPGSFPLGHGIRNRPSKLRAYGNAIVPQIAAEFIRAST